VAAEVGGDDVIDVSHTDGVKWVASFAPRSRVRLGDDVTIVADIERVHWFDPNSGEAIRG
jgi:multiple sugar transport system ATP-binding protein